MRQVLFPKRIMREEETQNWSYNSNQLCQEQHKWGV